MQTEAKPFEPLSLVELLRARAAASPSSPAYTFLADGEAESDRATWAGMEQRARAIGALLQHAGAAGERVLLLYPQGLDFVAAFYGCLFGGAVAVPAYPPRNDRGVPRVLAILRDARPTVVLTTAALLDELRAWFGEAADARGLRWIATDGLPSDAALAWTDPGVRPDTLAFLQYTSGSTASPRGVMVSHGNLLHNLRLLQEGWGQASAGSVVVSWLPLFHDMGLIGNVLEALHLGAPCVLMSPAAFLQRPFRWLDAVSRYGATLSGGPNFAYDLCVRRTTPEQRAGLDLSRWSAAFNGAEPVRADTLERFLEAFAPCGLRREALHPGYGLAEGTLVVSSGSGGGERPLLRAFDTAALGRGRLAPAAGGAARRLVGCGRVAGGQRVVIADPETGTQCAPDAVGEIWVAGPSVAGGYWERPEETERTFGARLAGTGEGPFLRTGDLGFLHGGELFVAGRAKDVVIVRGRNHYPQDLELTVERSHPAIRPGCGAAFAVEAAGEERLVVAAELERRSMALDPTPVVEAVRRALAEEHELPPHAVVLLKTGAVPKTTSGKIQRRECRARWLDGTLEAVHAWTEGAPPAAVQGESPTGGAPRLDEVRAWLAARVAERAGVEPAAVDPREPFAAYGLDSAAAVGISGELEEWLGRPLAPTLLYDHPTVERLARHLAGAEGPAPAGYAEGAATAEPIAIVGVGCRFPGAEGPEEFWRLLRDGVDAVSEVPAGRWDVDALYDADPKAPGKMSTRWGGFLRGVDGFDAAFWGIAPREAARMDPQQRLLLETAWEALEDAGVDPDALAGSATGVFVGISGSDYGQAQFTDPALSDAYAGTGGALSIAANRLSYALDLRGPSLAVDTACSSSLVALHLACRSLWSGECAQALAGGANLLLAPGVTVNFSKAGFMSPDGRCRAFDARANGYVRAEGAGVVVLKPLSRALADGDPVYAVVRGTAVNQDGRSNGLTAPSREAQEAVLREAYRRAGVRPGDVQYVEAHGTGTPLGDPIEAAALGAVLGEGRAEGSPCLLGSVKTNLGHLEAAAGIAGVVKVALAMRERTLPASLHFESPNPEIPFGRLPLRVCTAAAAWPAEPGGALAGVSSFGFGGTNAHVVLGEAPVRAAPPAAPEGPVLLPLSARSPAALADLARAHRDLLASRPDAPPAAEARAASLRRAHHDHRLAVVAATGREAAERLDAWLEGGDAAGVAAGRRLPGRAPRVAFVFAGQGSQWWGMARGLLAGDPVFRAEVERCDALFRPLAGWSLLEALAADESGSRVGDTEVAQPLIFAVQVGLAAAWAARGVRPEAVVGHSVGEVAAACVAGALSLEDAVRVVFHRGRLMQGATGMGRMAAVGLAVAEARAAVEAHGGRLAVAACNSPGTTTLSGEAEPLEALLAELEARGVFVRRLEVDYAFHSPQMEPFARELARELAGIAPRRAAVRLLSTVTGAAADGTELGAEYWARNVREPVLFAPAAAALAADGFDVLVELGPHAVLGGALSQCLKAAGAEGVVLASLRRGEDDRATMLASLGALYVRGAPVKWSALHPGGGPPAALPRYPWQRERHWMEPAAVPAHAAASPRGTITAPAHLPGTHLWDWEGDAPALERLAGRAPAAAAVAARAAAEAFGAAPTGRGEVETLVPLAADGPVRLQCVMEREGRERLRVRVFGRGTADGAWTLHAAGTLRLPPAEAPRTDAAPAPTAPEAARALDAALLLAAPADERPGLLEEYLAARLGAVLRIPAAKLERERPVTRLGLDSLMAVELRNALERDLGVALPLSALFAGPTVRELSASLLDRVAPAAAPPPDGPGGPVPLSEGQRALWFLHRLDPESPVSNVFAAMRVAPGADVAALGRAFAALVERHPALRTALRVRGGVPVQEPVPLPAVLRQADAPAGGDGELRGLLADEAHRPFDLESGELVRATLFRSGGDGHVLLLVLHHAATDFWSNVLLLRDLAALYEAEAGGGAVALEPAGASYTDFARWQAEMLAGPGGGRLETFWRGRLAGLPALALPTDRPRPAVPGHAGASLHFRLDAAETDGLRALAGARGTTPYAVVLAAYQALLARWSGQDDVAVASPASGRGRAEFEGTVGYFMNPVLLRGDLSGEPTFAELLERTREAVAEALDHQDFPLHRVAGLLQAERGPATAAGAVPFQAMLVFNRPHRLEEAGIAGIMVGEEGARFERGGLALESLPVEERTAVCDLCLWMGGSGGGMQARLQYDAGLFDAATAERIVSGFRVLLGAALESPHLPVAALPVLTGPQRLALLAAASGGESGETGRLPAHRAFEARAAAAPDDLAVAAEGERVGYGELNRRANRLAHHLRRRGVGPETVVGICLERSVDAVVAILAVLKAGGAYLPLDPAYPAERLAMMLEDSGAPVLVTRRRLAAELDDGAREVVRVDADRSAVAAEPEHDPGAPVDAEGAAYVIYTSGSTGRPKGTVVPHGALANHTLSAAEAYGIVPGDRVLQFAPLSFDASVEEIFPALAGGAALVLRTEAAAGSVGDLLALCRAEGVTVLDLPTAYWHQLAAGLRDDAPELPGSVRLVIIGGERALPERVADWRERVDGRVRLVNTYGPTEATVVATRHEAAGADGGREVPIGRPIRGVRAYVLDRRMEPVPAGVAGELYLAGAGLARGYLGRPGATAEAFLPDPFSPEPGGRLYATGDLARRLPGGELEFAGRVDQQVKVRGFRVEPAEVEAALARHPDVRAAVVVAREDAPGQRRLAAYLIPRHHPAPPAREVREFARELLPEHMLPAAIVFLAELPLTPSGKVDRRALPAPERAAREPDEGFTAPRTPVEETLAGIWAEVLDRERVGVHDDFFELGGDSILSIQVVARAGRTGLRIDPRHLFQHPTVSGLAALAAAHSGPALPAPE